MIVFENEGNLKFFNPMGVFGITSGNERNTNIINISRNVINGTPL